MLVSNLHKIWLLYLLLESLEMIHTRATGNVLVRLKWEGQTLYVLVPLILIRTPTRAVVSVCLTFTSKPSGTRLHISVSDKPKLVNVY